MTIYYLITFFWLIREIKTILFWIYLWQLKEYQIGRFLDHLKTEKGKKLVFNINYLIKIILLIAFVILAFFPGVTMFFNTFLRCNSEYCGFEIYIIFLFAILTPTFVLYLAEAVLVFKKAIVRRLVRPALTKKTVFLILINIFISISAVFLIYGTNFSSFLVFTFFFATVLLLIDILTPMIVSVVVLVFQPFAALEKKQIINKAKEKREKFNKLLAIGITGSYGKTSTKEFLATILSKKFKVLKTMEHQNSEIGVSQCILNELTPEHQVFIAEMGAYSRGGIKLLAEIAKPKIGIVSGVNAQHLALFGSIENLLIAEGGEELINSLPKDGLAIFNGDNKYCVTLFKKTFLRKKISNVDKMIAKKDKNPLYADIWAEDLKAETDFITFKAVSNDGDSADFKVNVLGEYNVQNILLASLVAKELGMTLNEISSACQGIQQDQGAMKLIKGINGLNIIDSTYSANPDGVIADLDYLKIWKGKRVIIMPCLIELGPVAKEIHRRIGRKIGEVCDLAIITTKEMFDEIREGAMEKGMKAKKIIFMEKPKKIIEKLISFCVKEDSILLESRVPREVIDYLVMKK